MTPKLPTIIEAPIGDELIQTVNARDLHVSLEVGCDFSTWVKRRIEECQFELNTDYVLLKIEELRRHDGHEVTGYFLTLDAAKEVCMLERNERGKEVRKYFIECERQLKDIHAGQLAALDDPGFLRTLLGHYAERAKEQALLIEAQGIKVEAHDRIAEAYGSLCITDAAKTLKVPPKALFRFLSENHWVYRRFGTDYIAYQTKIQSGSLVHKVNVVPQEDGTERAFTQVRVTPKGMLELAKHFPPPIAVVSKPSVEVTL